MTILYLVKQQFCGNPGAIEWSTLNSKGIRRASMVVMWMMSFLVTTCIEELAHILQSVKCLNKRNRKECWLIEGWNAKTSYRFNILHLPEQGLIRLRLYEGASLVLDSGNIIDTGVDRLSGGKLGVYCDSQENISWSALRYRWTWCSASIYKHIPKYLPPLDLKVLIKHICTTSDTCTYNNNTYNLFFFCDQSTILFLRIKL